MKLKKTLAALLAASAIFTLTACSNDSGSNDNSENTGSTDSSAAENQPTASGAMRESFTSAQLVDDMTIGWNLGNTLDVCQADRDGDGIINEHVEEGEEVDETLWGNIMTTPELFDHLKDYGINAVRIPITWRDHLDENDNIKESWMDRVQEIVDYAMDRGFYVIINMHHDGGDDAKFGAWLRQYALEDYDKFYARYSKLWNQIADRFRDYSDYLIFESMNEVGFDSLPEADAFALLNKINQDFVDLIRASGGNNEKRHLLIAGYWTDVAETCKPLFQMPADTIADHLILSVHYYTPWELIAGQQKTWGSDADIDLMTSKMNQLKTTFVDNGVPVIIGEYSGGGVNREQTYYCEYLVKLCTDMHAACFLWDNGGILDRSNYTWRVAGLIDGLNRAVSGEDYEVTKAP